MIWMAGKILADDAPIVSALDPALEHGIGLFETFRTWRGRPTTLDRHLARLTRSARVLGLPLDSSALPDEKEVAELLKAASFEGDAGLRLTLTGAPAAWLRSRPLPDPVGEGGATVVLDPVPIAFGDPLARHKTLNYWGKRMAWERARASGADEALLATPDGRIWEGSRTNLFLVRDGTLVTPGLEGPVLPGVLRGMVLEMAERMRIEVFETDVTSLDLDAADETFLTNAVRGVVPVGRWSVGPLGASGSIASAPDSGPGPLTRRLRDAILSSLEREEGPR